MAPVQNRLLARLPAADRERLLARCESLDLALGEVLGERGEPTRHVYFPVDCFLSLITQVDDHDGIEVGMVGREGMLGVQVALGVRPMPLRALVQGAGRAWRMDAPVFQQVLADSPALQAGIQRYVYVLMAQFASAASCLRYHVIGARLARWLLMSHDRAGSARFHVTHVFLSWMLGVRRSGITVAARALQDQGLITYQRGELTVLDRPGLEAAACSCYAADRATYAGVMGR